MNQFHQPWLLYTRPKDSPASLKERLSQAGVKVIDFPLLNIEALSTAWVEDLEPLDEVYAAIFISRNAVIHAFRALNAAEIHWPETIAVLAIGKQTAAALELYGLKNIHTPALSNSNALLKSAVLTSVKHQKIILFRGKTGLNLIQKQLIKQGAHLSVVKCYQQSIPVYQEHELQAIRQNQDEGIILLTSGQAIHNLFRIFGEQGKNWLCTQKAIVFGERLAQIARQKGMQKLIITNPDDILRALSQEYQREL